MKLTAVSREPGLTRLESTEDITLLDFQNGANPLEEALGQDGYASTVLLNLAKSNYIDSTGVGWLIQVHGRFHKAGGRLVLHSIAPMVNHCFRLLGMYDVLTIVANEEAALNLVGARRLCVAEAPCGARNATGRTQHRPGRLPPRRRPHLRHGRHR